MNYKSFGYCGVWMVLAGPLGSCSIDKGGDDVAEVMKRHERLVQLAPRVDGSPTWEGEVVTGTDGGGRLMVWKTPAGKLRYLHLEVGLSNGVESWRVVLRDEGVVYASRCRWNHRWDQIAGGFDEGLREYAGSEVYYFKDSQMVGFFRDGEVLSEDIAGMGVIAMSLAMRVKENCDRMASAGAAEVVWDLESWVKEGPIGE